jgi:hypothetical protein
VFYSTSKGYVASKSVQVDATSVFRTSLHYYDNLLVFKREEIVSPFCKHASVFTMSFGRFDGRRQF